jgi:hypothetical protein
MLSNLLLGKTENAQPKINFLLGNNEVSKGV